MLGRFVRVKYFLLCNSCSNNFKDLLWPHFHEIVNYEVQATSSADIRITFLHPVQFLSLTDDIHFLPSQVLPAICPQRVILHF